MTGREWLNLQDSFAMFVGPWLTMFFGAVVAGGVMSAVVNVFWHPVKRVKIVSNDNE